MSQTYFITGTSRGIGLDLTRLALGAGHIVLAVARKPEKSSGLQHLLADFPNTLKIYEADLNEDEQVEALIQKLKRDTSSIDILINNAGIYGGDESLEKLSLSQVKETLLTNAVAPMRLTRALLPFLKKSKMPKIAFITSLMGSIEDNSSGGSYGYRMSKAALNMFHKTFKVDFSWVISLAIHPGWVKTDMGGENAPTEPQESARGILEVLNRATRDDSGKFLDYEGETLPW